MALIDDNRKIERLVGGERPIAVLEENGVRLINAYPENGEMTHVPWFEVYVDGMEGPKIRVNGKYVEAVVYKDEN